MNKSHHALAPSTPFFPDITNLLDPHHVDYRDPLHFGYTRLHKAAEADNIAEVRRLLEERGANPNVVNNDGWTPEQLAAICMNDLVVEYLSTR